MTPDAPTPEPTVAELRAAYEDAMAGGDQDVIFPAYRQWYWASVQEQKREREGL